jgi:hypothetical protein
LGTLAEQGPGVLKAVARGGRITLLETRRSASRAARSEAERRRLHAIVGRFFDCCKAITLPFHSAMQGSNLLLLPSSFANDEMSSSCKLLEVGD